MTRSQQAAARVAERDSKAKPLARDTDAEDEADGESDEVLSPEAQLEALRFTRADARALNRMAKGKP
jgi:hypothetical protein